MNPPFRRTFEANEDTGQDADEGFDPAISFSNPADIGRTMMAAALGDQPETPETVVPEKPAPAAPEAPAEPEAAPADGGLVEPEPQYTINEDGSVVVGGHTYADMNAALAGFWNAQQTISRGMHKPPADLPDPEPEQDWDEEEQPGMLPGLGTPLGGEPSDLQDLVSWAEADITSATQWTLANQHRVPADVVNALYAAWHEQAPAAADAYVLQLQQHAARAEFDEREQRLMAVVQPLLDAELRRAEQEWSAKLQELPYWSSYAPRVQEVVSSDVELARALAALSPADQYEEIFNIYSAMRVRDSMAARSAAAAGAPVPGAGAPVPAAAAPAPSDPPVVERNGAPVDTGGAADPALELMRRGIAAVRDMSDPFAGPAT